MKRKLEIILKLFYYMFLRNNRLNNNLNCMLILYRKSLMKGKRNINYKTKFDSLLLLFIIYLRHYNKKLIKLIMKKFNCKNN